MSDIVQIAVVESYAESLIIESRLEEEEIPHALNAFNDPAFGSFWRRTEGWGVILAPSEHRARILEICREVRETRGTTRKRGG